jgi:hypothetical protein
MNGRMLKRKLPPCSSLNPLAAFVWPEPGRPPEVAVAVVVENLSGASADTGGATAGPVARAVLAAALGVS